MGAIMKFNGQDIRTLRQRLGWSMAEMGRRMGCNAALIGQWESEKATPDADAMNQLCFLRDHVDSASEHVAQKPLAEKEMRSRGVAQLTHRDLLKDIQ
jgi:transcriptional regulator with XRE-family HTH domain